MKVRERVVDYPNTCPLRHRDIELVDYEKFDLLDTDREYDFRAYPISAKVREMKIYAGVCWIYCHKCKKEYEVDCTITEFGKWKRFRK
jgi:hypothetical protein